MDMHTDKAAHGNVHRKETQKAQNGVTVKKGFSARHSDKLAGKKIADADMKTARQC